MKAMSRRLAALAATATAVVLAGGAYATQFSPWAPAQKIDTIGGNSSELNTASVDGCPIQSPDGLSLYLASNRPGGKGGLDIWVATRTSRHAPWGAPVNLGEPVNSAADDFCPTPIRGKGLFFVSRRVLPGSCGQGDIYFTRRREHGWREPERLACASAGGPNSELDEQGPSYVKVGERELLYFSRSSVTPSVAGDIFVSERLDDDDGFGPASTVIALNDVAANDIQPNVRKDGLEVVFSSSRAGGAGAQDIWVATRPTVHHSWAPPVNLGPAVNTDKSETRPSLSRRGEQLLFGRTPGPEGMTDIYVTAREKVTDHDDDD